MLIILEIKGNDWMVINILSLTISKVKGQQKKRSKKRGQTKGQKNQEKA